MPDDFNIVPHAPGRITQNSPSLTGPGIPSSSMPVAQVTNSSLQLSSLSDPLFSPSASLYPALQQRPLSPPALRYLPPDPPQFSTWRAEERFPQQQHFLTDTLSSPHNIDDKAITLSSLQEALRSSGSKKKSSIHDYAKKKIAARSNVNETLCYMLHSIEPEKGLESNQAQSSEGSKLFLELIETEANKGDVDAVFRQLAARCNNASPQAISVRLEFFKAFSTEIMQRPADTLKLLLPVLETIGLPDKLVLSMMTNNVLNSLGESVKHYNDIATYLYTLAKVMPSEQAKSFNESFLQVINGICEKNQSVHWVFPFILKKIFKELENTRLTDEAVQNTLMYYYSRFENAVDSYRGNFKRVKETIVEMLRPLIPCTLNNFNVYFKKMMSAASADLRFNMTISGAPQDRVLTHLLLNALDFPGSWSEDVIKAYKTILLERPNDGCDSMAFIHFLNLAQINLSVEYSVKIFEEMFNAKIKKVDRLNALSMYQAQLICEESRAMDLFSCEEGSAVRNFITYWKYYLDLKEKGINDQQCLKIGESEPPLVEEQSKWQTFLTDYTFTGVVSSKMANKWLERNDFLENVVFINNDFDKILTGMLGSLSGSKHQLAVIDRIVSANLNNSESGYDFLNDRLKAIINDFSKKESPAPYFNLFENIALIQIKLLEKGHGTNAMALMDDIANSLAPISVAKNISAPLKMLNSQLEAGKISDDNYLYLISRTIEASCYIRRDKEEEIIRPFLVNAAYSVMTRKGKKNDFIREFSKIKTDLPYKQSGYNKFLELGKKTILSLQHRAGPVTTEEADERQALASFFTSNITGIDIFRQACIAAVGGKSDAEAGIKVNIDWVINPGSFFAASTKVQHAMLLTFSQLQQDPDKFIFSCLTMVREQLSAPAVSTSNVDQYMHSVHSILALLRATPPVSIHMLEEIYNLYTTRQNLQGNRVDALSTIILNDLKALLRDFDKESLDKLSESLRSVTLKEANYKAIFPVFKPEGKVSRADSSDSKIRKRYQNVQQDDASSASEVAAVRPKDRSSKTVLRNVYIRESDSLSIYDIEPKSKERIISLMCGEKSRALRIHRLGNVNKASRVYAVDSVSTEPLNIQAKHSGRTDLRIILLKGSNNNYILLSEYNHKEINAIINNYQYYTKEEIDTIINNPHAKCRRLQANELTDL
ncbi:hypothetical protein J2125_003089 [Erwinia toletana]|uniref:Uncharacterized protein n=1 Tax=Winslowiella toletana TaxID=92490 RepID=A0ABS4PCJ7_9GAMM|nr:hypothetical protein [Winslowiella toletana]MBP2169897.1 hypothetical protein [Winslowiella toletana]